MDNFKEVFQDMGEDGKVSAKMLLALYNRELTKDSPVAYLVNNKYVVYPSQVKTPLFIRISNDRMGTPESDGFMKIAFNRLVNLSDLTDINRSITSLTVQEVEKEGWNIKPILTQEDVNTLIEVSLRAQQIKSMLLDESIQLALSNARIVPKTKDALFWSEVNKLDEDLDRKRVFYHYVGVQPKEYFKLEHPTVSYLYPM